MSFNENLKWFNELNDRRIELQNLLLNKRKEYLNLNQELEAEQLAVNE